MTEQPRNYKFHLQTPNGIASIDVPHGQMKQCPCGCDLFVTANRVCYVKPGGVIGAEPTALRAEIFVCRMCGRELQMNDPTINEAAARKNGKPADTVLHTEEPPKKSPGGLIL